MKPLTREQKISYISTIIVVGIVAAFLQNYFMETFGKGNYPFNTFLWQPWDRWNDFFTGMRVIDWSHGNPYGIRSQLGNQFPIFFIFFDICKSISPVYCFVVYSLSFIVFFVYIVGKNLALESKVETFKNAIIFSFLTYPFLFSIDGGNLERIIFVLLYLFIEFYKKRNFTMCMILLTAAVAFKPFPGFFLLFFLEEKRYKEALFVIIVAPTLLLLGYGYFPGGLWNNLISHSINLGLFHEVYAIGGAGWSSGHSLWGAIKILRELFFSKFNIYVLFKGYSILSLIILSSVTAYIFLVEKLFWKRVCLVVILMNLLPQVSGDHKMLHFYTPMFLFINSVEKDRYDLIYTILFALLLIPKNYYHFSYLPDFSVNGSVLVTPFIMISIMFFIIYDGIRGYKTKEITKACAAKS